MSNAFVGRRRELERLESEYRRQGGALVPIYGRRRVGKSELLLRFMRGKPGVYFLGKQAPEALQVREFLQSAAASLEEPLLAAHSADGWKAALAAVTDRWRRGEKLVLAFDEFQWTVGASPALPSVLQELWDREWKSSGRVLVVLCGSFIGFMEREILGRKSPLFGRRTAQILLRPFDYREAAEFHPGYSLSDRARAYFVCGGIPLYHWYFDAGRSIEQNVRDAVLDEYAPLHREPDFLLREELREVENYHAVLVALASGRATNREISRETAIGERKLHYYLDHLVQLRYVRKRYPLTERRPSRRDVRYEIDDPLLRFWFRFVFPNTSAIPRLGPSRAFTLLVRPQLESYFGTCFERLCREALPALYEREGVLTRFAVGEYWDRHVQIDVVGLRDDGWTDLGECRWGRVGSTRRVERELEEKVGAYPNARNASIRRRIFVRDAPRQRPASDAGAGTLWHDLADLYRA